MTRKVQNKWTFLPHQGKKTCYRVTLFARGKGDKEIIDRFFGGNENADDESAHPTVLLRDQFAGHKRIDVEEMLEENGVLQVFISAAQT